MTPLCITAGSPAAFLFSDPLCSAACLLDGAVRQRHCGNLLSFYWVFDFFPSQAVAHILPFRDQNRQFLDPIWNRHHVERVEVVLKETVDAKGW